MRLVFILLLVTARLGVAQLLEPIVPVSPEGLIAEGQALETRGEFGEALAKYQAAVTLRPDFLEAHLRQIGVMRRMRAQAQRKSEEARLVAAIRERFAAAAKCPDADWRVYSQWAGFLSEVAARQAGNALERRLIFEEALGLSDTAVMQATAPADLARARFQRAMLLVAFAPEVTDESRQLGLYEEACELFEAVAKDDPAGLGREGLESRAVAMLHHGRLRGDREQKNAALAIFREAVASAPGDAVRRYNLACAYAALGESDAAYEELVRSLRDDKKAVVFEAVSKDAEWARLRSEERFQKLLARYDPAVNAAYDRGWECQVAADRVSGVKLAAEKLQQAVAEYRTVTAARPDHFRAWWNLALCYQRLASLPFPLEERRRLVGLGMEAYQKAAQCAEADWPFLATWGRFVMREVTALAGDDLAQSHILQQAHLIFEQALRRVKFTGDRARLHLDLAGIEVRLGRLATADRERLDWFGKAVTRLQEVVKSEELAATAPPYALWGLAQMEQGRIQRNRLLLRQAVERLLTAAERAPTDAEVRYNLACAYALLGQADDSLRHLRICLENDRAREFASIAAADQDFDNIRNLPAFAEVVQVQPTTGVIAPAPARISGY